MICWLHNVPPSSCCASEFLLACQASCTCRFFSGRSHATINYAVLSFPFVSLFFAFIVAHWLGFFLRCSLSSVFHQTFACPLTDDLGVGHVFGRVSAGAYFRLRPGLPFCCCCLSPRKQATQLPGLGTAQTSIAPPSVSITLRKRILLCARCEGHGKEVRASRCLSLFEHFAFVWFWSRTTVFQMLSTHNMILRTVSVHIHEIMCGILKSVARRAAIAILLSFSVVN